MLGAAFAGGFSLFMHGATHWKREASDPKLEPLNIRTKNGGAPKIQQQCASFNDFINDCGRFIRIREKISHPPRQCLYMLWVCVIIFWQPFSDKKRSRQAQNIAFQRIVSFWRRASVKWRHEMPFSPSTQQNQHARSKMNEISFSSRFFTPVACVVPRGFLVIKGAAAGIPVRARCVLHEFIYTRGVFSSHDAAAVRFLGVFAISYRAASRAH